MSMTQVLTAIITLIVENSMTWTGIITIIVWVVLMYLMFSRMFRDRDPHYIVYILLTTVLAFFVLSAAPTIQDFIQSIYNKVSD